MFCPQCHAEYRPGFTRCSDCDVDLVENLAEPPEKDSSAMHSGSLVPLWEGEDLALHTILLEELEGARIPYFDRPLGVFPGVRPADPFPIQPMTRFGYKVSVLSSDLVPAREILERLLEQEPENIAIDSTDEESKPISSQPPSQGEEAIFEIWAGEREDVANFLRDAFRENEITTKVEIGGTETKIYVRPSDVARAREIVREVVEGRPPE